MPELPDIEMYVMRLTERVVGSVLVGARVFGPSVLRTVDPPLNDLVGRRCEGVHRIGKRIVMRFDGGLFAVIHLMIAGRLTWTEAAGREKKPTGRIVLAEFIFETGMLSLQEASTRKRASIHVVAGPEGLSAFDRGGLDAMRATREEFAECLKRENRTLKRALTNPALFDGIGNAYSDEILFAARLSPVRLTQSLSEDEVDRLRIACATVLAEWRDRLPTLIIGFPKPNEVTAFRPEFAVHGKFGKPCPECGAPVQHIVYAENETNYCARCQNEGRLLADRSLSRLLKADWPKTLEEMVGH
jgi:formamidopyrimidine-DNA glycosylase